MAVTSKDKGKSVVGAPAQRSQGTRKGKRAWRKNVDLDEVEQGLEEVREEERQFGSALHKKKDEDLFVVDTAGDDTVRKRLPKLSTRSLTAAKILAQRSAVPAVHSRSTPSTKSKLTRAEKERLLRIGKKDRKGPLNTLVDHTAQGEGSALMEVSHAASQGAYDVWGAPSTSIAPVKAEHDFKPGSTSAHLPPSRAPNLSYTRSQIATPAVAAPHAGASYNPPAAAHTELLLQAHEIEAQREEKRIKEEAYKTRVLSARNHGYGSGIGMDLDDLVAGEDEEIVEGEDGELIVKKLPQRKTKQQRRRAERAKLEAQALAEKASRKRLSAQVDSARRFSKLTNREQALAAARAAQRKEARMARLRKGLAGVKLGKHVVPKGEVDVQLGEELSESLRGLRVEGSLWRDRFVSMQQRALVEPRAQIQPSKGRKMKVYEKHDFKRFDAQP
ncbi:P60-like protein [Peniophora sp. CONT]|nr:P60-like protein [Peniophora sp. CONT]